MRHACLACTDFQGQLAINVASPGDATNHRLDFQRSGLICEEEFIDTNGLRGTRARSAERVRAGVRRVHGPVVFQPNSLELSWLLAWAFGGTPTGSGTVTYPLADTLPSATVIVDDKSKVMTYSGCCVDRFTLRAAQEQQIVEVTTELVGQDESIGNSGTFPVLALDYSTFPFRFYDTAGAITINGSTYNCRELTFTVDNAIDKERFFNSQTLVTVQPTDRHVHFDAVLPYGDAAAVYDMGVAGVAVTIVFTFGGAVLTLPFNNVKFPRISPHWEGRSEEFVPLRGISYKTGASTLEVAPTLNVGP